MVTGLEESKLFSKLTKDGVSWRQWHLRERDKERYKRNREDKIKASKERYRANKEHCLRVAKEGRGKTRNRALWHYGGKNLACVKCGETHTGYLAIYSSNGDRHKANIKELIASDFPDGYETLCSKCVSTNGDTGLIIKRGDEIGKVYKGNGAALWLWAICPKCNEGRWVPPKATSHPKFTGFCRGCQKADVRYAGGYRLLYKPNHRRADKGGYVREHILVWEQVHNKSLPEGWVVHHYNGVKDDNRHSNLFGMAQRKHNIVIPTFQKKIQELEALLNGQPQLI